MYAFVQFPLLLSFCLVLLLQHKHPIASVYVCMLGVHMKPKNEHFICNNVAVSIVLVCVCTPRCVYLRHGIYIQERVSIRPWVL